MSPLLGHYEPEPSGQGNHDHPGNVSVRTNSDEQAAAGVEAVLAGARAALDRLPDLLAAHRDPSAVFIPWQGWALTVDDLVTTRLMETIVHSDDLAASVGLPDPGVPRAGTHPGARTAHRRRRTPARPGRRRTRAQPPNARRTTYRPSSAAFVTRGALL